MDEDKQAVESRESLSPAQIRQKLQDAVMADLLGPANGPDEIVDEPSVRDRYLIGRLGPQGQRWQEAEQERVTAEQTDGELDVAGADDEDGVADARPPQAVSMQPSSIGLSFVVSGEAEALRITARWGRYLRADGQGEAYTTSAGTQRLIWRRTPVEGVAGAVALRPGRMPSWAPNPDQPDVRVEGMVRRRSDQWHVTLFLVNGQREPKQRKDEAWVFQPELAVEDAQGRPVFERRPVNKASEDPELRSMAMAYRNIMEYAVGHGVGVHAVASPGDPRCAIRLETRVAPLYDVPQTRPVVPDGLVIDMRALAETPDGGFGAALNPMVVAYEAWIADLAFRTSNPSPDLAPFMDAAPASVDQCLEAARRIRAGIALLDADRQAAEGFRFANRAMADQRDQTIYATARRQDQDPDLAAIMADPANHSWRTFQLAFILLNLPALTDPKHPERGEIADLLWFPTGGGKTEAYLGVAAYTMAIRRLQGMQGDRSGLAGVAVLMRYTLRLLTLQQFQRAAALMCACELIRRSDPAKWGDEPFRIGLWVGRNSTPNSTEDAAEVVRSLRDSKYYTGSTPHQLTYCPWCGAEINPGKHIDVETPGQGRGRTFVYCGDPYGRCEFSKKQASGEGLPVVTVDEEIYRRLPALLIATVDKFAQMPWNGRVGMLFGQVNGYCERHGYRSPEIEDSDSHPRKGDLPAARTIQVPLLRPPDLIIQDELHLISGPLGTMVGLYEAAVDRLASWELDGVRVQPKVIASTATVRRAGAQVDSLFARQVRIFPAQGLDVEDNFFSQQVPVDEENPGRRYLGIFAPGVRHKTALIRVYTAFLSAAEYLFGVDAYGQKADPWMTLVGYFNSLRELGGMKRAADDSINVRLRRMGQAGRPGMTSRSLNPYQGVRELTSRRSAAEIPEILDQLSIPFDPVAEQQRRQKRTRERGTPPLDVLLATNMISVGVDVSRLGLMVVAGQPKNTAEYIQATSRVGRQFPGLVCTVYNWTRPRDISHYERFEHYHATFYQHVEALSVTPFAPRALDRGLSGAFVSLVRLAGAELNANDGASRVSRDHVYVLQAADQLVRRAGRVTGTAGEQLVRSALAARIDQWMSRRANLGSGARLGYRDKRDGITVGLLQDPDNRGWTHFTCLNSLRDVEPTSNLVLNEYGLDREGEPAWQRFRQTDITADEEPSDDVD